MVIGDKADAIIADYPICRVALLRNPDAGLVSFVVPLTVEPIGIAVPKEDPLLATWLENFLVSLRTTKQLEALQNKWFDNPEWLSLMK
jgi:polar amino acid transport system substrate-binding protein